MQQDIQEKQTQKAAKQVYEKPQLGKVSLFADRVLSTCYDNDNTCEIRNLVAVNSGP